jgi:hypothetical protein
MLNNYDAYLANKQNPTKIDENQVVVKRKSVEVILDSYDSYLAKKNPAKIEEKIAEVHEVVETKEEIIESTEVVETIEESVEVVETPEVKEEVIEGYKLYRDKAETFKCELAITGANPSQSSARVIIESSSMKYVFEGSIDENGHCEIQLPKMDFLNEQGSGTINLEVIADDTLFKPWSEKFTVTNFIKATVKSNNK